MTKTAASLVKRTRAAGPLGAAALLALAAAIACGSDNNPPPSGGGASGGSSGSSSGSHSGGKSGTAGSPAIGGEGGTTPSGNAGEAGMSEAGAAGATPTGPVCGNGVLEAGEQCDDGNHVFGDSCSPTCTNTCEVCEKDSCGSGPDTTAFYAECYGDGYEQEAKAGANVFANAQEGPAAGAPKNKLCRALVACLKQTKCAGNGGDDFGKRIEKDCYCGTKSAAECLAGDANGPCQSEIAAAAESANFVTIAKRLTSNKWAAGAAYLMSSVCDADICGRECVEGKPKTACDECAVGTVGAPCTLTPCYFSGADSKLCGPAADCALRTGCAAKGTASCYGAGTGPCTKEFAAAAKSDDPATIKGILDGFVGGDTPLATADTLLKCEVLNCKSVCFPNTNGGAGGGGGTGGGGTGGGGTGGTAGGGSGGTGG